MSGIRTAEEALQTLYLFPVPVVQIAPDGRIELLNPHATQLLLALGLQAWLHDGWALLAQLDADVAERARLAEDRRGTVADQHRVQARDPLGGLHHLALTVVHTTERACTVVIEDVTRLVAQERELQRQRAQLTAVLGAIRGYCVCDLDLDGRMTRWNESVERTLGWRKDQIVGHDLAELLPPASDLPAHLARAAQEGWSELTVPLRRADGEPIWMDLLVAALADQDGRCDAYCLVARDVSERVAQETLLREGAEQDPLTGLANRRGLTTGADALLAVADRDGLPVSIATFDIDHFKRINDTFGHAGGDAVLVHLAHLLRSLVREGDVLARVGGEEFVLILRALPVSQARGVLERIRAAVEASLCEWQGEPIRFTVSAGLAARQPTEPLSAPWDRADRALYEAKRAGRNRVVLAT